MFNTLIPGWNNVKFYSSQTKAWTDDDQNLWCHVASSRHKELKTVLPHNAMWGVIQLISLVNSLYNHMNCSVAQQRKLPIGNKLSITHPLKTKFDVSCGTRLFNSLCPSDTIWYWRSWSTLVQVMACCLMAPSHYLNQYWLAISGDLC